MRNISSVALIAALALTTAGCKKAEPVVEATTEVVVSDAAVAMPGAIANLTSHTPGDYMVTTSEGKDGGVTTLNADGSYKDTPVKGLPKAGLVTYKDGKICFDPSGPKEGPECWTETVPAADGSFTATSDKGTKVTVKPKAM